MQHVGQGRKNKLDFNFERCIIQESPAESGVVYGHVLYIFIYWNRECFRGLIWNKERGRGFLAFEEGKDELWVFKLTWMRWSFLSVVT